MQRVSGTVFFPARQNIAFMRAVYKVKRFSFYHPASTPGYYTLLLEVQKGKHSLFFLIKSADYVLLDVLNSPVYIEKEEAFIGNILYILNECHIRFPRLEFTRHCFYPFKEKRFKHKCTMNRFVNHYSNSNLYYNYENSLFR